MRSLARIHAGLLPGGLFLLSEKVVDEDPHMEDLLVELHHEHKRRNDYSQLEISRKRAALENVLIPETVAAHRQRLAHGRIYAQRRLAALFQLRLHRRHQIVNQ